MSPGDIAPLRSHLGRWASGDHGLGGRLDLAAPRLPPAFRVAGAACGQVGATSLRRPLASAGSRSPVPRSRRRGRLRRIYFPQA